MERDKLKLIVRNLELLVDSLKAEVYSDTQSYMNYDEITSSIHDYDEIFEDDNDDGTNGINNRYRLYNDDDGDGL